MMDHDGIRQAIAAHALDALDPDERGRVERELLEHLPGCDECLTLMRDLREVGGELALGAGAATVSPALEDRILAKVREDQPAASKPRRRRNVLRGLVAASVVALVASLGFNAALVGRTDRAERNAKALSAAVQLASDPTTRSVTLRGQSGGMVLLYQPGGKATLIATNIEPPPSGKVFELWLIKDGRPQPVLTFKPERGSVIVALPINPATFRGVAVTIEEGLVQSPTSEPIYAGNIEA
jgi:hypothetical protein